MNSNAMDKLSQLCRGKEWFHDVSTDEFGRFVVYANFMSLEILTSVPEEMDGTKVLLHFATSLLSKKENFTLKVNSRASISSIDELIYELDRLEKICGSNSLQDIFYEVHDGKNSVTNVSARFPEVRKSMERLYSSYGFNVVYEELDG